MESNLVLEKNELDLQMYRRGRSLRYKVRTKLFCMEYMGSHPINYFLTSKQYIHICSVYVHKCIFLKFLKTEPKLLWGYLWEGG